MALTDEDLLAISNLLQPIREDVQELKSDVQVLKVDVQELKVDVQELKVDVQELKGEVKELKRRTTSIELTLENVTNRNIKQIAEGHLDLSRKLDDALKVENEKEMLLIRVNILEDEMRKIKERLDRTA